MERFWFCIMLSIVFLSSASNPLAETDGKGLVRLFNIIPLSSSFSDSSDQLDEVAFSINNRADRPVEWMKIQIVVRNPDKEIIHSEDKEIDFVKYMGELLAPGVTKQMKEPLFIRGYRTSRGSGSVDLKLIDVRLSEK